MFAKTTVGSFKNLIILECFICINRSYLLLDSGTKTICHYSSYFIYISVISAAVYEIVVYPDIDLRILAFQGFNALELLALSIAARWFRKQYIAVEKLDTKFGVDDEYENTLKGKADFATSAAFLSLIADVVGMMQVGVTPGLMMLFCLGSAAHDAEMKFISLFINIINIRLKKSINTHPSFGCTVYRHILIASSYLNGGFQLSILMMWLVTLINSITFGFTFFAFYSEMTVFKIGYVVWREIKSLYSLWVVCFAAYQTEVIWKQLGFNLASRLAFYSRISNDSSSKVHQTLLRWYSSVATEKIVFKAGQNLQIGLYVPVIIMDVSVHYLLIMIQFYMADIPIIDYSSTTSNVLLHY